MVPYLVGHNISQQHNMPRVDDHVVRFHGILDLVDDGSSCGFDTKHLGDLDDMIGRRMFPNDTCRRIYIFNSCDGRRNKITNLLSPYTAVNHIPPPAIPCLLFCPWHHLPL